MMTTERRPFFNFLTREDERRLQPVKDDVEQGVIGGEYDGEISVFQFRWMAFLIYLWRGEKGGKNDGSRRCEGGGDDRPVR